MNNQRRASLSTGERLLVRRKTNGHCHICGGNLGKKWTADHVVPHGLGGKGSVNNYLPACRVCNGLRWFYEPEEIRKILQLGVYGSAEIRKGTPLGKSLQGLYERRVKQNKHRGGNS
jgi:5-methylcytosine-specific restriction endonuclease McrA